MLQHSFAQHCQFQMHMEKNFLDGNFNKVKEWNDAREARCIVAYKIISQL